jgi:hypothetical protein
VGDKSVVNEKGEVGVCGEKAEVFELSFYSDPKYFEYIWGQSKNSF